MSVYLPPFRQGKSVNAREKARRADTWYSEQIQKVSFSCCKIIKYLSITSFSNTDQWIYETFSYWNNRNCFATSAFAALWSRRWWAAGDGLARQGCCNEQSSPSTGITSFLQKGWFCLGAIYSSDLISIAWHLRSLEVLRLVLSLWGLAYFLGREDCWQSDHIEN